ncbi:hypothetical protein Tco_0458382 [Tanacetum coccineum]
MAGVYNVSLQGAYNPPGYAQSHYDQYYQQYPPPPRQYPPQYQQQQQDDKKRKEKEKDARRNGASKDSEYQSQLRKFPHPLLVVPSLVPSSDDLYLIVGQAHTPATVDTESEPEEAPSETEEFKASNPSDTRITSSHSSASSDSTAPLSPDHPLTQTSPTPTPTRVSFHHMTARMAMHTQPTLSQGMSA